MCDQQSLISACAYAQSDQSLCLSLEYSVIVKLLTEHHLEFLSLKGGCRGSSKSTLVKMSNCWKSHAVAQVSVQRSGQYYYTLFCSSSILGVNVKDESTLHQMHVLTRASNHSKYLSLACFIKRYCCRNTSGWNCWRDIKHQFYKQKLDLKKLNISLSCVYK